MLVILYILYGRSSLKCVAILLGQTKEKVRGQDLKSKVFSEIFYKTPKTRGLLFFNFSPKVLSEEKSLLIN